MSVYGEILLSESGQLLQLVLMWKFFSCRRIEENSSLIEQKSKHNTAENSFALGHEKHNSLAISTVTFGTVLILIKGPLQEN